MQGPVVTVTATDNGDRGLNGPVVEKEDACYAISTRKAHIIISSWMVMHQAFCPPHTLPILF